MEFSVRSVAYAEVEAMRDLYRHDAGCQIVRDSFLKRQIADPYMVLKDGCVVGYGAVSNRYDKGRMFEFYTVPSARRFARPIMRELLEESGATELQAQTNMPLMVEMLFDFATAIVQENILFDDAEVTRVDCPGALFRRVTPEEKGEIFEHHSEPVGDWAVEFQGEVVGTGGFLCHYNPPYGDVYMEVSEPWRRKGIGSFLVQEVKRVCYEAGRKPGARCDPGNIASRRTLQRAGFLPCGRLLAGKVRRPL